MSVHGTAVAEAHGVKRSGHWPTVEKHFLMKNPRCLACKDEQHAHRLKQVGENITRGLQVHHAIIPFHYAILLGREDLEFDERNLCVLCEDEAGVVTEDHHNLVGHLRNFRSYAPDAMHLAKATFHGKAKTELLSDKKFLDMCANLPKEWASLTEDDKKGLRKMLDEKLPRK